MTFFRRRRKDPELAPDEIFLDSSNLPAYDRGRLEGRLERPIGDRTFLLFSGAVLLLLLAFGAQAAKLELADGSAYAARSENNRLRPDVVFATRGALIDRNGVVLAGNEESEEGFPERVYRHPGFGHLLGYVSYPKKDSKGYYYETATVGKAGAEAAFEAEIAGMNGLLLVEENALGDIQSAGRVVAPEDGRALVLSIDARAQEAFASTVAELAERIPFTGGSAVLMDVETGEVHALVSYPEYDPNVLSEGGPAETIREYATSERQVYLDRAVSGLYAPGSIVKPIVAAAALEEGVIDPATIIVSTGSISIPNPYFPDKPTIFPDWKPLGPMDMRSAIAYSSDVYFYTVGGGHGAQQGLGIDRLARWFEAFGYGTATGIELPGESEGFVPTPAWKEEALGEDWGIGNTYHTSIGQYAMQITPMEAVRATAAIANGGTLVTPTLVKGKTGPKERIQISAESLRVAREGMRQAVMEGTASGMSLGFTEIAAKTGTAQLGTLKQYVNAWVIGFFPYEEPRYAFAVVMEKGPQSNLVGGVYVAGQSLLKLRETAPEYFE